MKSEQRSFMESYKAWQKPRLLPHTNPWASPMAHKYQRQQELEQPHSFSLLLLAEASHLFPCPYTSPYWSQNQPVNPADNHQQLLFCRHAAPVYERFNDHQSKPQQKQLADAASMTAGKTRQGNGVFPSLFGLAIKLFQAFSWKHWLWKREAATQFGRRAGVTLQLTPAPSFDVFFTLKRFHSHKHQIWLTSITGHHLCKSMNRSTSYTGVTADNTTGISPYFKCMLTSI